MKLSIVKNMTPLREAAKRRIDEQAVRVRERRASHGVDAIYAEKGREAERFQTYVAQHGTEPDLADFTFMVGEVERTGMAPAEVAALWSSLQAGLKPFLNQVEIARLTAKSRVDTAATPGEIDAIVASIVWPE
jgi:hypothetical protein